MFYKKMKTILHHETETGVRVRLSAEVGIGGEVKWDGVWEVRVARGSIEDTYVFPGDCSGAFRKFLEYAGPPAGGDIIPNVIVYDYRTYRRMLSECRGGRA